VREEFCIIFARYRRSSISPFLLPTELPVDTFVHAEVAGNSGQIKNVDGLVSILYAFPVLYSLRFSSVEFVESSSAVYFKKNSQSPPLTLRAS